MLNGKTYLFGSIRYSCICKAVIRERWHFGFDLVLEASACVFMLCVVVVPRAHAHAVAAPVVSHQSRHGPPLEGE